MLERRVLQGLADSYEKTCVASLGSHSALDISEGAKAEGLRTVVVCQKGRDATYARHYKTRKRNGTEIGVVDEVITVDKFKDVAKPEVQEKLRAQGAIFIPHRSFEVYVGYDLIENEFKVPIFGSRALLRAEERTEKFNQYTLLKKAGVRTPMQFKSPSEIDRLVIVKAPEAKRSYERAFFYATDPKSFEENAAKLVKAGIATKEGIEKAVIEEYVLGAHYNFNYFMSPLTGELELLGVDMRRQTNLDGVLRLPARDQMQLPLGVRINNIEVGHVACTLRESLLEEVFEIGEAFVKTCRQTVAPGIIGPFALQGALTSEEKGEKPIIFDVSLRVPGSPGTRFTPYTGYLHRENISTGRRIAMEIRHAFENKKLGEVVT